MTNQEREKYFNSFIKLKNALEYAKMALSSPAGIVQNEMEISEEILEDWKGIAGRGYDELERIFNDILSKYDKLYAELCQKLSEELENKNVRSS